MHQFDGKIFEEKETTVDENEYVNCKFIDCVLSYAGGKWGMVSNDFLECTLQFNAAASRTLGFLSMLHNECPEVFEEIVDQIRGNPVPANSEAVSEVQFHCA